MRDKCINFTPVGLVRVRVSVVDFANTPAVTTPPKIEVTLKPRKIAKHNQSARLNRNVEEILSGHERNSFWTALRTSYRNVYALLDGIYYYIQGIIKDYVLFLYAFMQYFHHHHHHFNARCVCSLVVEDDVLIACRSHFKSLAQRIWQRGSAKKAGMPG